MEILIIHVILSALVALIGINRKIGYVWSFIGCLFLSPLLGLVLILSYNKKKAAKGLK